TAVDCVMWTSCPQLRTAECVAVLVESGTGGAGRACRPACGQTRVDPEPAVQGSGRARRARATWPGSQTERAGIRRSDLTDDPARPLSEASARLGDCARPGTRRRGEVGAG